MSRIAWFIFAAVAALLLLVSACSGPPEDAAVENVSAIDLGTAPDDNVEDAIATANAVMPDMNVDANVSTNAGEGDPAGGPPAGVEEGRGAFVDPGDMEIDNWATVEFVVGRDETALAEEAEGQELTAPKAIFIAPRMRVALQQTPNFEVRPQSPDVLALGADRRTSWQWSVKPLAKGSHTLVARVEVLDERDEVLDSYTRRVAVNVRVGTWRGFLNALREASTLGDVLGTLFRSWQKTLLALTALIGAAVGLSAAIRRLRSKRVAPTP